MFNKKIKFILKFVALFFYSIIVLEVIARTFLFFITINLNIFLYGFNNIEIVSHSFKNLDFYISQNKINYEKINYSKVKNNNIWVFGGSTSNKGFCDSTNISWVDLLEEKSKNIKNFSRNGVYSNYSLKVLLSKLQTGNPPRSIIWANKVNEIRFSKLFPVCIAFLKSN